MLNKIIFATMLMAIVSSQNEKYVDDAEGVETTTSEGLVTIKHKVAETQRLTEQEIIDSLGCFRDSSFTALGFDDEKWNNEVMEKIESGLEENKRYTVYFDMRPNGKYQYQFLFWRVNENIFASVMERVSYEDNLQGSNVASRPVWEEKTKLLRNLTVDCFKIIPQGCKYSGQTTEYFEEFCRGYDLVGDIIKEDILKISALINTQDVGLVDSNGKPLSQTVVLEDGDKIMNPSVVAGDFAKCIKTRIRNNSIQLDCAVKGIPMDHSWAIEQLRTMAKELNDKSETSNIVVDEDKLTLSYQEDLGVVEEKEVLVTEEDFEAPVPVPQPEPVE